jgi:hypothetical protein
MIARSTKTFLPRPNGPDRFPGVVAAWGRQPFGFGTAGLERSSAIVLSPADIEDWKLRIQVHCQRQMPDNLNPQPRYTV